MFGQKWDESRYWKCIQDASLVTDLEILPDGDLTEVGTATSGADSRLARRVSLSPEDRSNALTLLELCTLTQTLT